MNISKIYPGGLLLLLSGSGGAKAAVCTSQSADDWKVIARWSCGHITTSTDTVGETASVPYFSADIEGDGK